MYIASPNFEIGVKSVECTSIGDWRVEWRLASTKYGIIIMRWVADTEARGFGTLANDERATIPIEKERQQLIVIVIVIDARL